MLVIDCLLSQFGGKAMGLRFEESRGVIRLIQWNIRESALMLRLGLMRLAENIRSGNVPNPTASTRARAGRILSKMAVMAAFLVGGYLAGRLTIFENAPTSNANASQAQAEPPAPEPLAPLIWASQVSVIREASLEPPPASEVTAPKPASKPIADTRPLNSDEILETQAWLKAFGFDPGPLDGLPGPKTADAVKRYRIARQMEETGSLDRSVLQQVRQQSGQPSR
ncbi:MAG: peptidoglycan-binding domain-containing protein [Reyranella sp.]